MTTDHLTPEQKAASPFFENFWDSRGWGLGLSIVARRAEVAGPGRFGWDGAFSTSWYVDPREDIVGVLMFDFWTAAYRRSMTDPKPDVTLITLVDQGSQE